MEESTTTHENPAFDKEDVEDEVKTPVKINEDEDEEVTTPIDLNEGEKSATTKKSSSDFSDEERLLELRSIRWNIACLSISGLLVTSPINGLMNSTTSLLDDEGLGITSLAASSIAQFLGAAFLLSYINHVLGVRRMVSVTLILPLAFILSFAYPSWGTTLPGCILLGLSLASLTSTFMYGTSLGFYYAQLSAGNSDVILVAVTGFLSTCFVGGYLLGNGIVFAVFNIGVENSTTANEGSHELCGANYCNEVLANMTTLRKPETFRYYMLVGIFSGMAAAGGILSLFVRDFSCELGYVIRKKRDYFAIMKETLVLLKRPRSYLLVVITIFIGLEQAFTLSVYTYVYISCALGITKVGLIMMGYGGIQVIMCFSQGLLVRILGRLALIIVGVCMVQGCLITLLFWHPNPDDSYIFFILSVVWAAGDAAIFPSTFAMYGILFEESVESSLSLGTFWWAVGFMIAFIWSQFLCVYIKLYITIAVGCLGIFLYIILEVTVWRNSKKATDQMT